jgi:hypothetical protein
MNQKPFQVKPGRFFYFIESHTPLKIQLHILLHAITLIINGIIFASYNGQIKIVLKAPYKKIRAGN